MGLLSRFDSSKQTTDKIAAETVTPVVDEKRASDEHLKPSNDPDVGAFGKKQAGVKKVEAVTKVWTKWHLIGAYFM